MPLRILSRWWAKPIQAGHALTRPILTPTRSKVYRKASHNATKPVKLPPTPKKKLSERERAFAVDPYVAILTSPIRLCRRTRRHYPSALLHRLQLVRDEEDGKTWAVPSRLVKGDPVHGQGHWFSATASEMPWISRWGWAEDIYRDAFIRPDMGDHILRRLAASAFEDTLHAMRAARQHVLRTRHRMEKSALKKTPLGMVAFRGGPPRPVSLLFPAKSAVFDLIKGSEGDDEGASSPETSTLPASRRHRSPRRPSPPLACILMFPPLREISPLDPASSPHTPIPSPSLFRDILTRDPWAPYPAKARLRQVPVYDAISIWGPAAKQILTLAEIPEGGALGLLALEDTLPIAKVLYRISLLYGPPSPPPHLHVK